MRCTLPVTTLRRLRSRGQLFGEREKLDPKLPSKGSQSAQSEHKHAIVDSLCPIYRMYHLSSTVDDRKQILVGDVHAATLLKRICRCFQGQSEHDHYSRGKQCDCAAPLLSDMHLLVLKTFFQHFHCFVDVCAIYRTYHSTRTGDHSNVQWLLHDPNYTYDKFILGCVFWHWYSSTQMRTLYVVAVTFFYKKGPTSLFVATA